MNSECSLTAKTTRKLTKSVRVLPAVNAQAYVPLMDNQPTQFGHSGVNTWASQRAQQPQDQGHISKFKGYKTKFNAHAHVHDVGKHILVTVGVIPWTQKCSQKSQGQFNISEVKGHRTRIP